MKQWILHSWDDEHCLKILKNCYKSLPEYGKVIVVDIVVPETPDTSVAVKSDFQFDLFLMNMNPGGKERTKGEFESLAKEAGFSSIRVAVLWNSTKKCDTPLQVFHLLCLVKGRLYALL